MSYFNYACDFCGARFVDEPDDHDCDTGFSRPVIIKL